MTLPAALIAVVRTGIQALVAWALSAAWVVTLLDWLSTNAGVEVSQQAIESWAFGLALVGVTWIINWAGKRWTLVNKVFSLFTSDSAAVYEKTPLAGGGDVPDTAVDTGGEGITTDRGAVTVGTLLALVAGVAAVAFFFIANPVVLAVGILCLAVAYLAGGAQIG